ncbi:MAG: hypothetical protein OEY86_13920 [Nitrospira sp.]|nr:hypothetical protein [Nitrospira sp.]
MMGFLRKSLGSIVWAVLGILIGIAGTAWWIEMGIQQANKIRMDFMEVAEAEEAFDQYQFAHPEVASYALKRYIRLLESYQEENLDQTDRRILLFDKAIAYVRLGFIAERLNDTGRASEAYSRAWAFYQQARKTPRSMEELKELVHRLDSSAVKPR